MRPASLLIPMNEALSHSEAAMAEASALTQSLAPLAGVSYASSLFGNEHGGVRLDLFVRDTEELATPFVEDAPGATDERVLAGVLSLPGGVQLQPIQIRIQNLPSADGPMGVSSSDARWNARSRWVETHPDFPPARFVLGDTSDASGASRLGPRLYCRARRTFFRPRSPESLQPLMTCRDEAWLQQQGVPGPSAGGLPVLYSPADKAAGKGCFFAEDMLGDVSSELVGDLDQCILAQGKVASEIEARAESEPEIAETARQSFPCYRCPSYNECYPSSGFARARERLVPLNFHDATAIVTLRHDLLFGAYTDWLNQGAAFAGAPSASGRLWLNEDLNSSGWLSERVFLQSALLAQVSEQLAQFWETHAHGLGCLSESTVGVHLGRSSGPAPRLWTAEVGFHAVEDGPNPAAEPKYSLKRNLVHAAGSEFRGQAQLAVEADSTLDVTMGWLSAATLRPVIGLGDQIQLTARPSVETQLAVRGVVIGFVGDRIQIELHSQESLTSLVGQTCQAEFEFSVSPSVADDLYGLGVLMVRAYWVDQRSDLNQRLSQLEQLDQQLSGVAGVEERQAIVEQAVREGNWRPVGAKGPLPEPAAEALTTALALALSLTNHTGPGLELACFGEPLGLLQAVTDRCVALSRRLEGRVLPSQAGHRAHDVMQDLVSDESSREGGS